jgi:hypothetical protein
LLTSSSQAFTLQDKYNRIPKSIYWGMIKKNNEQDAKMKKQIHLQHL